MDVVAAYEDGNHVYQRKQQENTSCNFSGSLHDVSEFQVILSSFYGIELLSLPGILQDTSAAGGRQDVKLREPAVFPGNNHDETAPGAQSFYVTGCPRIRQGGKQFN